MGSTPESNYTKFKSFAIMKHSDADFGYLAPVQAVSKCSI
uniref:Uncharacterized protein n=1 Tax=Anguilla anguilla TaxID=7936 RepID=A0A0E9PWG0_ANGAN